MASTHSSVVRCFPHLGSISQRTPPVPFSDFLLHPGPDTSPLVVGNLLMVIGMPVSAAAAYIVLRKWHVWLPAAAIGGLAYGFSPYMVGQGLAHPAFLFMPLPPFFAMTIVSILQGSGPRRRLGNQLGLLMVAQYLIWPEVLATIMVIALFGIAFAAIRNRTAIRKAARNAAVPVAIAVGFGNSLLGVPDLVDARRATALFGDDLFLVEPHAQRCSLDFCRSRGRCSVSRSVSRRAGPDRWERGRGTRGRCIHRHSGPDRNGQLVLAIAA